MKFIETIENNVLGLCEEHANEKIKEFNENLPDVKPGDYVKAAFGTGLSKYDGPPVEHMWIEVTEVKVDSYVGELNNTPFFIPKSVIRLGSNVEAKFSQCSEYLPKEKVNG